MVPMFSAASVNDAVALKAAFARVLDSQRYVLSRETAGFEAAFADYCGVGACVGVGNGTDALEIGLAALGVGTGDTVVTVANAGFYASTAIHALYARPVYVDVDPASLTLSPDALRASLAALDEAAKAIVVTHLYGRLADMDAILPLAAEAGVPVLEDCAQAHGAQKGGVRAGAYGALATFSFYPTKNLGAIGDGGAVVGSDPDLMTRVRELRQYGWSSKYTVAHPHGRNSRLDEVQAAFLNLKLAHLDAHNAQRRAIAARYDAAFADLDLVTPPGSEADTVAHLYVVRSPDRAALRARLQEAGVMTDIHYPIPDHRQPVQEALAPLVPGPMEVTEDAARTVLSLPCYPGMPDADVDRVIAAVRMAAR